MIDKVKQKQAIKYVENLGYLKPSEKTQLLALLNRQKAEVKLKLGKSVNLLKLFEVVGGNGIATMTGLERDKNDRYNFLAWIDD